MVTNALGRYALAGLGLAGIAGLLILPVNAVSKSFAIAAIVNFLFFSYYFKNIYNPASIFMSMFLFMIGCSQAKLTLIEQDSFASSTWLTLFSVILVFYAIVAAFMLRHGRILPKEKQQDSYTISAKTIFWSNIICLSVEIIIYYYAINKIGSIPLFDDNARANIMPHVISNPLMTLMVIPTFFIIFNTAYTIQTKKYGYLFFSVAYLTLLILLGGRINIFIPVITSLFYTLIQYQFAKENKKSVAITGTAILITVAALMVTIPLVRTQIYVQQHQTASEGQAPSSGSDYYATIYNTVNTHTLDAHQAEEKTKQLRQNFKPTMTLPPQMMSVWINLSTEMHAFNKMVIYFDEHNDFRDGRMLLTGTFRFISKYFMPDETLDLVKMGGYDWINIMTFMQKPYMDFGVAGVAGFMLLFTLVGMTLYQRVQQRRTMTNMLLYSYFCMATLFMVFDNHFYYSTVVVNVLLLLLFKAYMKIDWLKSFNVSKSKKMNADKAIDA
ncbi:O-antigen polymerase [Serratia rubidaea]|uniref:O-antigen polymerase n=1 Tax=Serratia rubidaea TaxID=61652 RepID=UPI00242A8478|nr:O-antigen polymerase [Serratia rubidaea]MCR0999096.1 oligosaccharide repeat unit polymerase [Serratia rubidaea]